MKINNTQFKMNDNADSSIFTSCFALFILDLFDQLKNFSRKKRNQWIDYIQSFQDKESGYFMPGNYNGGLNTKAVHQLTAFCLSALHILGVSTKYDLKFLSQWNTPEDVHNYLRDKGCFQGLPGSGNMAMFLAIFFSYKYEKCNEDSIFDLLKSWFYWHNRTQNPRTGFWGNSLGAKYFAGFQNAFHQFVIYNYWKKLIQYNNKIVNTVLMLQDSDGFFAPNQGGGGCWDYDAADILINCGYKRGYREKEIRNALTRLYFAILESQNTDGGFCESQKRPSSMRNVFFPKNLKFIFYNHDPIISYYRLRTFLGVSRNIRKKIYTHWTKKGRHWHQSDIWNTWFRCLTLAEIDKSLNLNQSIYKIGWRFHNSIGLGYFRIEGNTKNC